MNAKGNYRMSPAPATLKRCDHGFLGGENCYECHPELMCCALCGNFGHESKLCPETKAGRSRVALLRERRKRERDAASRRERMRERVGAR